MKSTFRTLFYLKRNEPKKNGNVVIMVRITVDGGQTQFSSKLDIHPDMWDTKNCKATGRTAQASNLNRLLDNIRANISMHYTRLMDHEGYAMPEKIKNAFLGIEEKGKTILSYFEQHNEQYKLKVGKSATHKTYTRYELTKERLKHFMKEKYNLSDMPIKEINVVFIENFYLFIREEHQCTNNTTMKFIQRLRTIIYYAKNTGLVLNDPFSNYKFRFDYVDREILTQEEIDMLYRKDFASNRLTQVRDMFVFSCYTGLSYIDVCELKESHIKMAFDNHLWIMTKRHKTNVNSNIRLLDIPKEIVEKYKGTQKDGLLLPVISNQKMNDYLKEIAEVCGIDKKITFHTARHSFATTIGLSNGVPIETVSKMLGHTNIRTTQIYAKITDLKISNDMEALAQKINARKIVQTL